MSVLESAENGVSGAWLRELRRAPRRRRSLLMGSAGVLVIGLLAVNILLGSYTVTIGDFFAMLGGESIPGASFIVMENKRSQPLWGRCWWPCLSLRWPAGAGARD